MHFMKKALALLSVFIILAALLPISGVLPETQAVPSAYVTGDIIEFGSYPQSSVTDTTLTAALNEAAAEAEWQSYGCYAGDGEYGSMQPSDFMQYKDITLNGTKYRAVTFSLYRPSSIYREPADIGNNSFAQYQAGYRSNTVYWFRFENLRWRVLDGEKGLVLCESLIDGQAFSDTVYTIDKNTNGSIGLDEYFSDENGDYYMNSYVHSSLREMLNNDFYNTAFSEDEKAAVKSTENTNTGLLPAYTGESTVDKVFLPARSDLMEADYGFEYFSFYCPLRFCQPSEYARIQGVVKNSNGNSNWYTRTAGAVSYDIAYVTVTGYVNSTVNGSGIYGVRPEMTLDLSMLEEKQAKKIDVDGEISVKLFENASLEAALIPVNTASFLTYESRNNDICTVDENGIVTGVSEGQGEVLVKASGTDISTVVYVNVKRVVKCETLLFGSYPQSRVLEAELLTQLNALITSESYISYGFYSGTGAYGSMTASDFTKYCDVSFEGERYRAVHFSAFRPTTTIGAFANASIFLQRDNRYYCKTTYWFKYEPLEWTVLDENSKLVFCSDIVDVREFNSMAYGSRTAVYSDEGCTIRSNNYEHSTIRAFLNGSFADTAFDADEKAKIKQTTIENDAYNNAYTDNATTDSVFLLSYNDYINKSYGFEDGTALLTEGSDYSKCLGLNTDKLSGLGLWYFRTPYATAQHVVSTGNDGVIKKDNLPSPVCTYGVRPAMYVEDSVFFTQPVTGVELNKYTLSLKIGENEMLIPKIEPADAADTTVSWKSSDDKVCTVDENGTVSAINDGSAVITVTTKNGLFTAECTVAVTHEHEYLQTSPDTATCTQNGSITLTCSVCGKTKNKDTLATGHSFTAEAQAAEYLKTAASCTAAAVYYKSCVHCGLTIRGSENEAVFSGSTPNGHSPVTDAAVAAGCTKTGLTQGSHCGVCGEVLAAQTKTSATGIHNMTASGFDKTAKAEKYCCADCDAVQYLRSTCDVDGDGKITSADARLALRAAVKLDSPSPAAAACADADGAVGITSADARLILRAAVGLENAAAWKKLAVNANGIDLA